MTCPETLVLHNNSVLPCVEKDAHTLHIARDATGRRLAAWVGSLGPETLCECAQPAPGPCLNCDGEVRR